MESISKPPRGVEGEYRMSEIALFEQKEIRREWDEAAEKWWFSVEDIVGVLTDSSDPKQYIKKMRSRDGELSANWGTICTQVQMVAKDGKRRKILASDTEGILRIIQSIPSPKAEPFKLWLARVGYERMEEIANPELAQQRMVEIYRAKGYSEEWIGLRMRGMAVRDTLTDEWKARGIEQPSDYAILTAEISKATFGMTPSEYRKYKGLKKGNVRDHMSDLELIFTMLGEASTTEIAQVEDAQGFVENKKAAQKGGKIAGDARKNLELETGRKVSSRENYIEETEQAKRKRLKGE